ncbi:Pathogenesis-related protein 1B [Cocos nucifera]|uniref:Pathogenesis-related protein 1B n=1 Tax=Cocos nucifera TaxID=13894 RepID=A0A8K0I7M4_COCNU|nr:Pathogenesis-related protein 1B [Cocos nucifera]
MTTLPSHAQNSPKDYVDGHNTARSEVGVGPIEWNSTLESYAVNYANQRAGDCQLIHSQGTYGENIYTGYGQGYSDGVDAVRYWYNEKPFYNYVWNQCSGGVDCLHYTQMVWRNSARIGCARVECSGFGGRYFVTCNYDPPGNILGERPY